MRDVQLYLNDILSSISNIDLFVKGVSKVSFKRNIEKQSAVARQLEIIGEAVKNLPEDVRRLCPEIPWKDIAGLRDVMIHSYHRVDVEKIWNVIDKDLPPLKESIKRIMQERKT